MDTTGCIVIGAGVAGLAVTEVLSRHGMDVVLLERHDAFGRETSSRNSEVIHAGFYYPSGSLKARLCVKGNSLLYAFCEANNVPYKCCGKLVVAQNEQENEKIGHLFEQGRENGVPYLELCAPSRIRELEPAILGTLALLSRGTGIFDTHTFMKRLEQRAQEAGATIAYNCEVRSITRSGGTYEVLVKDVDGSETVLQSERVVNAAGLSADRIAAMAGIDVDRAGYRIRYCKGEYFSVSNRHKGRLKHLVYPAPTTISLGIHGVLGLEGAFRLGPSAFYVDEINYDVDPAHGQEFFINAKSLFPFLEQSDLAPDMAGIRPKLQREGESFHDFIIRDEAEQGMAGLINMIGIESPGLTSALALAAYVKKLVMGD
jgi:L-2-hydroxyglutarate oxidase LhgO